MPAPINNPILRLFNSRKFLLLLFDTIVSLSLYFVGKYFNAAEADLKFLVAVLQPVFVTLIGSIAYEDAAQLRGEAVVDAVLAAQSNPPQRPASASA